MKSMNTAWCLHEYEKSSPLHVRWTRVTHPMGTRLIEEDPDSTCVRVSLFLIFHCACVQTSLFFHFACVSAHVRLGVSFFPLRICTDFSFFSAEHAFRRLSFHFRCACVQGLSFLCRCSSVQTSPLFRCACVQMYLFSFPPRMRSEFSNFFPPGIRSVVSLLWKAEKKRPGLLLQEVMCDSLPQSLKFQTKLCDLSTATID